MTLNPVAVPAESFVWRSMGKTPEMHVKHQLATEKNSYAYKTYTAKKLHLCLCEPCVFDENQQQDGGERDMNASTTTPTSVTLSAADIPGASLSEPLEAHATSALKWWLLCRGFKPPIVGGKSS